MGIRIPQSIIKECHFENEIELSIHQGSVVLTPIINRRQGWKMILQDELLKHPVKAEGAWEW